MNNRNTQHWTGIACEAIALLAIAVLVGLGKVPSEAMVVLATMTIAGHSLGGRNPPPGAGPLLAAFSATGAGALMLGLKEVVSRSALRLRFCATLACALALLALGCDDCPTGTGGDGGTGGAGGGSQVDCREVPCGPEPPIDCGHGVLVDCNAPAPALPGCTAVSVQWSCETSPSSTYSSTNPQCCPAP